MLLRREGWAVNKKRVQRLWRETDVKVPPAKERKRRRVGSSKYGTEVVAKGDKRWLAVCGDEMLYTKPESPWKNVYLETL